MRVGNAALHICAPLLAVCGQQSCNSYQDDSGSGSITDEASCRQACEGSCQLSCKDFGAALNDDDYSGPWLIELTEATDDRIVAGQDQQSFNSGYLGKYLTLEGGLGLGRQIDDGDEWSSKYKG